MNLPFYYDEIPKNANKRNAIRVLFNQIRGGRFTAIISPLVAVELSKTAGIIKEKLLGLINDYKIEVLEPNENEVSLLVDEYMKEQIVPEKYRDDARHVAYATCLEVDVLVTYNLEHLANEWKMRQFNGVNLKQGYNVLAIRTPEEVIFYGE